MAQAIGAVVGVFSSFQSLQAQKKAQKAAQKQQQLADTREKKKLMRQQAIEQGKLTNVAGQTGGLGSTAVAGGLSGLTNQVQSQVGYQAQSSLLANLQSKYMMKASTWDTIGSAAVNLGKAFA